MKNLYLRFKSELNSFWKGVRNFALWLGGACSAGLAANALYPLDTMFVTVLKYIVIVCAVAAFQAQMTKK
jgi:hypothetical protein